MAQLKAPPAENTGCAELTQYVAYLRAQLLYEIDTREAEIQKLRKQIGERT